MLKPHDRKCVCNFQIALLKCTKFLSKIVSAFKLRYTAGYLNKEVNEKKQIA